MGNLSTFSLHHMAFYIDKSLVDRESLFLGTATIPGFEEWALIPLSTAFQQYGIFRFDYTKQYLYPTFILQTESIIHRKLSILHLGGKKILDISIGKPTKDLDNPGDWIMRLGITATTDQSPTLTLHKHMKSHGNRARIDKTLIEGWEITCAENNWGYIKKDEGCIAYSYFDSERILDGKIKKSAKPSCGIRLRENLSPFVQALYLAVVALENPYSSSIVPSSSLAAETRNSLHEQGDWGILAPAWNDQSPKAAFLDELPSPHCRQRHSWTSEEEPKFLPTLMKNLRLVLFDPPPPSKSSMKQQLEVECGHVPLTQHRARALSLFSIDEETDEPDVKSTDHSII